MGQDIKTYILLERESHQVWFLNRRGLSHHTYANVRVSYIWNVVGMNNALIISMFINNFVCGKMIAGIL